MLNEGHHFLSCVLRWHDSPVDSGDVPGVVDADASLAGQARKTPQAANRSNPLAGHKAMKGPMKAFQGRPKKATVSVEAGQLEVQPPHGMRFQTVHGPREGHGF